MNRRNRLLLMVALATAVVAAATMAYDYADSGRLLLNGGTAFAIGTLTGIGSLVAFDPAKGIRLIPALYATIKRALETLLAGTLPGGRVKSTPGSRLHALADFFYSRKTRERIFDPMLADMRDEYFEALAKGRVWKARWIHARYCIGFVQAFVLQTAVNVVKQAFDLWKLLK